MSYLTSVVRALLLGACLVLAARGASEPKRNYDLAAGDAAVALRQFSDVSGREILFAAEAVRGVRTSAIKGNYTAREALDQMVSGTPLRVKLDERTGALAVVSAGSIGRPSTPASPEDPHDSKPPKKKITKMKPKNVVLRWLAALFVSTAGAGLQAQTNPSPNQAPADQAVPAVSSAESPEANSSDRIVRMSQYEVTTTQDQGYFAKNSMIGTGRDARLVDIAQSVQIMDADLLADINEANSIHAMRYGASGIKERSEAGSNDIFVRGFRVIGFLKDGQSFGTNFEVPLYDVDRIEIAKGPAALLFGQVAATGGVVNYVTKSPTDRPKYSIQATAGDQSHIGGQVDASGPIGASGLRYRVTVEGHSQKGPAFFQKDNDQFFGFGLDYRISPQTIASMSFAYYDVDYITDYTGIDPNTGVLANFPRTFTFQEPWVFGHNNAYSMQYRLISKLTPSLDLKLIFNAVKQQNNWLRVRPNTFPNPAGLLPRTANWVRITGRDIVGQIDLSKTLTTGPVNHVISFGAKVEGTKSQTANDYLNLPALNIYNPVYVVAAPTYTPGVGVAGSSAPTAPLSRSTQYGGYVSEDAKLFKDRLTLVGGVRYNGYVSTTYDPYAKVLTDLNDQKTVRRYGAIVKPVDDVSLYFNHSESFTFNSGVFVNNGPTNGQQLKPSLGTQNEIGAKVETRDGHLFGSVAGFDIKYTNVRFLYQIPGNTLGFVDQSGYQHNRGYEADIGVNYSFAPGAWQTILTVFHGHLRDQANNPIAIGVNNTASAFSSFKFKNNVLDGFEVSAGVYTEGSYWGPGPAVTAVGPVGVGAYKLPAYTTTVASIGYDKKSYRVYLTVDNVFNTNFVDGGEAEFWLFRNPGRTYRATVEFRF